MVAPRFRGYGKSFAYWLTLRLFIHYLLLFSSPLTFLLKAMLTRIMRPERPYVFSMTFISSSVLCLTVPPSSLGRADHWDMFQLDHHPRRRRETTVLQWKS